MKLDTSNPLAVQIPYNFTSTNDFPTEVMAGRFSAWRSVIKDLVNYFREYANVQEEIVRQQARLQQAISAGNTNGNGNSNSEDAENIKRFFLGQGNGSVSDIPTILFKYHQQNVTNSSKTLKDINNIIIPKLEELRKDLLVKIKEIKNLQNDFKNNLTKELAETKSLISQYNQAIELSNKLDSSSNHHTTLHETENGKFDPYLVKIKLDRQLKRQLSEENYLYEAYSNLQSAGRQLESIVVLEIQNYVSMFLSLVNEENSTFSNYLLPNINNGFLGKESNFEWDAFIERNLPNTNLTVSAVGNQTTNSVKNGTFIDLNIPKRHLSELVVKNCDSNLNVAVREGYLERRSKFLKNYTSAWYVLTCSFIHEFKSNDRKKDPHPVMSLSLDSCTVSDHSKNDNKSDGIYKFILTSKSSNALMHKTHKWVFRTDTFKNMIDWYDSINKMTSLPTPAARARTISGTLRPTTSTTSGQAISRISTNNTRSPTRSLKTISTNNTTSSQAYKHKSLSQVSSDANHKRISSTFSQRNNQSPRLSNMINSDGTIITPVDTDEQGVRRSTSVYSSQGGSDYHNDDTITEDNTQPQEQQQQQGQAQDSQHLTLLPNNGSTTSANHTGPILSHLSADEVSTLMSGPGTELHPLSNLKSNDQGTGEISIEVTRDDKE
ncbi:SLM2 Phosphatidylinositol 4 [Candida maltosa Xu316]